MTSAPSALGGLALFFQLVLARVGKLHPGIGHLFKLLSVRWRRGPRHIAAFRGVLKVFVPFSHKCISHLRML